jgi:PAS domain S-box-containing protein
MNENELLLKVEASSGVGGFAIDAIDGSLSWTPQLFRLHGLEPGGPTPSLHEFLACIDADDRPRWHAAIADARRDGMAFDIQGQLHPIRGDTFRVRAAASCERAAAGGWHVVGRMHAVPRRELSPLDFVVSSAGIGIWDIDLASGEEHWSDITLAMYGLPAGSKAPTRQEWHEKFLHPDDAARAAARVDEFVATQRHYELEYRIRRADGGLRWLHSRAVFAFGDSSRVLGITLDITERKLAEERARQTMAVLDVSTAQIGFGFGYRDLGTDHASFWSDQLKRMYGVDVDGPTPDLDEFLELLEPVERERTAWRLQQAKLPGQVHETEFKLRRRNDGQVRHFVNRAVVLDNAETGVPRRYFVVIDLTELRAKDAQMSELLERLQLTTEASGIGTWERDIPSGQGFWDATMRALHGYPPDAPVPSHEQYMAMVHRDDREPLLAYWQALREGHLTSIDYQARFVLPDGSVRRLQTRGRIQRDNQGDGLRRTGICYDITERHEAEAALQAKALAESASAAKTEFLSRMSHELRTPLNAVLGFAQLMALDKGEPLGPKQRERLDHVHTAGWHLLALINDVLDLARIESRQTAMVMGWTALAPIIRETLAMTHTQAAQRNITVSVRQDAHTPEQVWTDVTRLQQLLLNLMSNAVKYNVEGGRVELHAWLDAEHRLCIAVRDTGLGMSSEQLQGLFEPFNRLGREGSKVEGTGIGLSLSKSIAEQMGGHVQVQSTLGRGSEFMLVLPQPKSGSEAPA